MKIPSFVCTMRFMNDSGCMCVVVEDFSHLTCAMCSVQCVSKMKGKRRPVNEVRRGKKCFDKHLWSQCMRYQCANDHKIKNERKNELKTLSLHFIRLFYSQMIWKRMLISNLMKCSVRDQCSVVRLQKQGYFRFRMLVWNMSSTRFWSLTRFKL